MNSVTVFVSSCDGYEDVWRPFFTLFFRFWPDCPFPVCLVTNERVYPDARVRTLTVGRDRSWAATTAAALERLDTPFVLYLQEDYLLNRSVDTPRIVSYAEHARERQVGCLRLFPSPGPRLPYADHPGLGQIDRMASYRVSLQAALWDRQVLASLLVDGESPWEMEIRGSVRSRDIEKPFLSVRRDSKTDRIPDDIALSYFCTGIARGRWVKGALDLCRREGVPVDLERRKAETLGQRLARELQPRIASALQAFFVVWKGRSAEPDGRERVLPRSGGGVSPHV